MSSPHLPRGPWARTGLALATLALAALGDPSGRAARVLPRVLRGALVAPALAQSIPDPGRGAAALRCERAIGRAGASLVARRLHALELCTTGTLSCVQTKPGNVQCLARAGQRCARALASIAARDPATLAATIQRSCDAADLADLLDQDGLGYAALAPGCGGALADLEGLAACLLRGHARESDLLFAAQAPRARELIDLAGGVLPPDSSLPAFGGSGAGVNDPKGAGRAIQRCTSAITKAGARLVGRTLRGLTRCTHGVHTCVQTETKSAGTGKAEKVEPTDCMPQATAACDAELTRVATATAALRQAVARRCAPAVIAFETLGAANGANLEALEEECARYDVPALATIGDYELCLTRQHACRTGDLLRLSLPRARELAAHAGRRLQSEACAGEEGLATVQSLVHVDGTANGLDGPRAVAVSPDGAHVYVASFDDDSLALFSRDAPTGTLTPGTVLVDGVGDVDGLNGARGVATSPDGAHVYVAASRDDAVAVFARDPASGSLTFVQRRKNGAGVLESLNGARGVAVSPDGAHVYVVADPADALAVFARDPATGALTFIERKKNATDGVDGLDGPYAVTVSPDGAHVYVAAFDDDAVAAFTRDPAAGTLTFVEREKNGTGGIDGLDGARAVTVAPDGKHVYVAGSLARAVAIFARDPASGALDLAGLRRHVFAALDGLTQPDAVVASADGTLLFTASALDNVVAAFDRDATSGRLRLRASHRLSIGADSGEAGVLALATSPDALHLYATESTHDLLEVLERRP